MVEAVGHANLPAYMQAIGRLLKPGGTAVVQVRPGCAHLVGCLCMVQGLEHLEHVRFRMQQHRYVDLYAWKDQAGICPSHGERHQAHLSDCMP